VDRLILDTGALIALERGTVRPDEGMATDADVAICAITAAELLVGVALADDSHRARRETLVAGLIERVEILPYDLEVARHHATLLAHVRRAESPRGAHDLQIAATGRAKERTVLTTDRNAFRDLPGVSFQVLG
jgi:tRNA(fMet)-specific endonuclease VapC